MHRVVLKTKPLLRGRMPRRAAAEERGAEIVEFAIVFPVLCTLLIGMIWMGRAYNLYETITRAAREGARALVLTNCASCTNPNTSFTAAAVRTNFVEPVLTSDFLDPTKVTGYTSKYVWLDPAATPKQQCGVAISFSYPFTFVLPFTSLNLTTISISTRVQMRMENQPTTCQDGVAVP